LIPIGEDKGHNAILRVRKTFFIKRIEQGVAFFFIKGRRNGAARTQ
jgi:hypothetical protein